MLLLVWTLYWYAIWYLVNFRFKPHGITYSKKPFKLSLFFFSSAMIPLFYTLHKSYYSSSSVLALFAMTVLVSSMLSLIGTFFIAKSFDVLFQQLMFLVLINLIAKSFPVNNLFLVTGTAIFFGLVHFLIIFLKDVQLRFFYFFMSLIGGTVFTILISTYDTFGIIYSYSVHMLFYITLRSKYPEPND